MSSTALCVHCSVHLKEQQQTWCCSLADLTIDHFVTMDTCRYQVSWTTSSCRRTIMVMGARAGAPPSPMEIWHVCWDSSFFFPKGCRRLTQFTRSCLWSYPWGTHKATLYWLAYPPQIRTYTCWHQVVGPPFSSPIFTTIILGVLVVCFVLSSWIIINNMIIYLVGWWTRKFLFGGIIISIVIIVYTTWNGMIKTIEK